MDEPPAENAAGRFRSLGSDDAALLAALHADSFEGQEWDAAAMADLLAMPGAFGFVIFADEEPRGYLLARLVTLEAEIISLAVQPEARRQGLARALMQLMIDHVSASGGQRVFLEVAESNHAARRLYGSLGFRDVGRRPGYYHGKNGEKITALVMAHNIRRANS